LAAWNHPRLGPALKAVVAYSALFLGVEALFGRSQFAGPIPTGVPLGVLLIGLVIGSLYSLIAFGLILVYRANRIISFAQAGLGSVPAVFALTLVTQKHLPYLLAVPIALVGAVLVGVLVETLLIRRFRHAPRLILTVATIGIAQILALIEFYIPIWLTGTIQPGSRFRTPLTRFSTRVGGVVLTGDALACVVVVTLVMVALGLFFRFTKVGIAVRASAENEDRALLLGIPVRRVSTVVWIIAALCSSLGIFLRAPVVGLPFGGLIGPTILLYALAAAIVARMESLPVALVAGMAIGVIDNGAFFGTRKGDLGVAMMLPLILVALLVQSGALSRAADTGVNTWKAMREFRPIPIELRNLPSVRWARSAGLAVVVVLALWAPVLVGPSRANFASLVVIYAIVAVSLVVLTGWAGQISLGQFGFVGVGAAVAGGLAANHHWDFFAALFVAGLAGAAVAVLIGLPALRVQGLFLAVVTLAFAASVVYILLDRRYFGWLLPDPTGTVGRPLLWGRVDVRGDTAFYYVCLAAFVLVYLSARTLRSTRSGRVFVAVRDNTRAAQSYGTSPPGARLAAFAISGFYAALAGALLAYHQGAVDQSAFALPVSIDVFVMAVIGGLTSLPGAVLGAVYYQGIKFFSGQYIDDQNVRLLVQTVATGVGVLTMLAFLPGGLAEVAYRWRDAYLRWVANRHSIVVPSLVADLRVEAHAPEPEEEVALTHAEESLTEVVA
jgi:branched-chain amino acid transport system permease protein